MSVGRGVERAPRPLVLNLSVMATICSPGSVATRVKPPPVQPRPRGSKNQARSCPRRRVPGPRPGLIYTVAYVRLRWGEPPGLRTEKVDPLHRTILIEQQFDRGERQATSSHRGRLGPAGVRAVSFLGAVTGVARPAPRHRTCHDLQARVPDGHRSPDAPFAPPQYADGRPQRWPTRLPCDGRRVTQLVEDVPIDECLSAVMRRIPTGTCSPLRMRRSPRSWTSVRRSCCGTNAE